MGSHSGEAISAYQEYSRREQNACRSHPFVMNFIYFFVDSLDLYLDLNLFPRDANKETPTEEALRIRTLCEVTDAFIEEYEDTSGDFDLSEELRTNEHAYSVLVEVFYFCLNRRPRQPSDIDRDPDTKTANELRRDTWWAQIKMQHEQARRSIRKKIRELGHVQRDRSHDAERPQHYPDDPEHEGSEDNFTQITDIETEFGTKSETEEDSENDANSSTDTQTVDEAVDEAVDQLEPQPQAEQALPTPDLETETFLSHALELDPINREEVFDFIVVKTKERHGKRYAWFFETEVGKTVGKSLEEYISPTVRDICESGSFTLESLRSIGGDCDSTKAGVYMNILWHPSDPGTFWLYIGQAIVLCQRIADHCDKLYRPKHPSLHYHVWDSREGMQSQFVVLAYMDLEMPMSLTSQCLLNLLEMWMACIFRTLTARDLHTYLPPSVSKQSAGRHLNVAPPIWQRFPGDTPAIDERWDRQMFLNFLHSEDPAIKQWAEWARDSYNDLRNSPDPRLREYWFENNKEQLRRAREASDLLYLENMKAYQEHGSERVIKCAPDRDRGYVNCGKFVFSIPKSLSIPAGSTVHIQFHLYQVPVPFRYAQQARPDDPSSRLAVWIKGQSSTGAEVRTWLQCGGGEKTVMKMNTLVDALEGLTYNETRLLRRRWLINRTGEGREVRYNS